MRHTGHKKHKNSHAREVALQALYQMEVADQPLYRVLELGWLNERMEKAVEEYCRTIIQGVVDHWEALNRVLDSYSDKDITQISTVNRCIIRMGFFELTQTDLSPEIVIDDLLNLTRKYEGDEAVSFVNGILDRFENERNEMETEDGPDLNGSSLNGLN